MKPNDFTSRQGNPMSKYDPNTKIWSGDKAPIEIDPDTSLGKLLLESLLENPDHIGQICCNNGKEYTNQEIADFAISIASHLKQLGFQQGEVVGFVGSNTEYVASLVIGALLNGLAISTLDPSFQKDGIMHIFSITKPSIMFCDGSNYDHVKGAVNDLGSKAKIYTMVDHISGVPDISEFLNGPTHKDHFQFEPLKEGPKQIAFILCSSGTTGLPKGVCMSHASLGNRNVVMFFKKNDRLFCYSSLYWASGLLSLTMGILAGSTRLISKNPFSVEEFFEIIDKFKPRVVFSPPSHLALSLASLNIRTCDISTIECYLCGGSAVSPSLIAKVKPFMQDTEIIVGYGMSELPGFAVSSGLASENGTVGKLSKNVEMKIIDDDNKSLGPNETGEILVRTTLPFLGYYGNSEATGLACDEDGWIHSGDIGYVNDAGDVFIIDRRKDILKYNKFHFSPTEIECVIMEIPDVVEVCVYGIPDEISSFLSAALIVPKTESNLTEEKIYKYVENKMDHFNKLRGGVYFVKDIPKTPSGKNLRRVAVKVCENKINN